MDVPISVNQAGFRLRAFSVDMPTAAMFPQSVEVLIGDVTDSVAVQTAMQDVDAVVHLAALLHIVNPPPELREKYKRINVGGTATVIEAAIKAGVSRVVLFSTIAVYGPSYGRVLNEMSPTHPDTFYAQTKCAAEQIVLNARGAGGQPLGTVLRLGAVYGSRIKGNYERLVRALARHRFIPIGNGSNRRTLVYDKDVGRVAALAVSHPAAAGPHTNPVGVGAGRIFNVTDGEFHTLNEIIGSICSALGRKPPRLSLPVGPTRTLIRLIEKGSHTIGIKPPITRAIIDKYTEDIAVSSHRIQNELGFKPQYDLRSGWQETVQEMRRMGQL